MSRHLALHDRSLCNELGVRRGTVRMAMRLQQLGQRMASDGGLYGSTPRRSSSASIASKKISAGITARLVQRTIAARAAMRYSVMRVRPGGSAESLRRSRVWTCALLLLMLHGYRTCSFLIHLGGNCAVPCAT